MGVPTSSNLISSLINQSEFPIVDFTPAVRMIMTKFKEKKNEKDFP